MRGEGSGRRRGGLEGGRRDGGGRQAGRERGREILEGQAPPWEGVTRGEARRGGVPRVERGGRAGGLGRVRLVVMVGILNLE